MFKINLKGWNKQWREHRPLTVTAVTQRIQSSSANRPWLFCCFSVFRMRRTRCWPPTSGCSWWVFFLRLCFSYLLSCYSSYIQKQISMNLVKHPEPSSRVKSGRCRSFSLLFSGMFPIGIVSWILLYVSRTICRTFEKNFLAFVTKIMPLCWWLKVLRHLCGHRLLEETGCLPRFDQKLPQTKQKQTTI